MLSPVNVSEVQSPPDAATMPDTYFTIKSSSEGAYTELRSKFLSFAHPVETADEAKTIIKEYASKYHDARHVCWAYMIGAARNNCLCSDNGEPSGTAGKPILGQINSFNLTNIVIVVVRYFGGIKLGTSGLIAAYREAARDAITAAEITERHEQTVIDFTFGYLAMNDVMRTVKQPYIQIIRQEFDNACRITLSVRSDEAPSLKTTLAGIPSVSIL